jgi:DNA-binding transcriptional ArsR family regulator
MGRRGHLNSAVPLEPKFAEALADTMFALSTPSRVQILYSLLDRAHDVTELVEALGMEQSAVSHQLRVLREQALVRVERDGSRRVYALADDHVVALLREAERHVRQRDRGQGLLARVRGSAARSG